MKDSKPATADARLLAKSISALTKEGRPLPPAVLTAIGSLLAFTTYGWLLRVAPLPVVATYAYVNPVVAVFLGAVILGEPVEPRTLVAGAVIVTAVALIVTTRGRLRTPATRPTPPRLTAARVPYD